ncbi:putative U4/U6.U5 tri-snRNP-associated protein 3-like protein [Glarea lozoyensis 74030]|uniref:Putative U4/U6.U5 tri-snRNP-associated protein 3-like protein n=1 Tax=Glarea lozoyensis (strain ATCC 74030 / MF5533) TaxID=1104152 RepID=H0ECI4_GLAL7|nr:putative U4/U6.U5 tri-snRNP-associated protein 3-like protein [Glarea lozoyensis 74030]
MIAEMTEEDIEVGRPDEMIDAVEVVSVEGAEMIGNGEMRAEAVVEMTTGIAMDLEIERERNMEERRDAERELKREDREKSRSLIPDELPTKSRTATPPVSFKVGAPQAQAQDHDRMEVDLSRKSKEKPVEIPVADEEDDDEIVIEDDGMADMQAMMGFGGFSTTQNKKILGNNIGAVRKEKKTEYRQYMNRVGGFNRPLSPTRDE